jgi:hypothetical protein
MEFSQLGFNAPTASKFNYSSEEFTAGSLQWFTLTHTQRHWSVMVGGSKAVNKLSPPPPPQGKITAAVYGGNAPETLT